MKKLLLTLLLASAAVAHAATAPTLIPFQGRLTDQAGVGYTNGQFTLIFNLYDQAVGGNVLWTETHQKVGVVNGMVNVFLGSINPALASVDFSQTRHLGITIDADNNPNTPDPEMVPRQMIIPAFFAQNSAKLAGFDWSSILAGAGNNPTSGKIAGSKIETGGITASQIANGTITSVQLGSGIIGSNQINDGAITFPKLAQPQIGTNVGVGGIAISLSTGAWASSAPEAFMEVTNLDVTISTRGGILEVFLFGDVTNNVDNNPAYIAGTRNNFDPTVAVQLWRNGVLIREAVHRDATTGPTAGGSTTILKVSPSLFRFIDQPSAGTHRYTIRAREHAGAVNGLEFYHIRLIAREF